MPAMWMVRGDGGRLYETFRERGVAAIGWPEIADLAKPGVDRQTLAQAYRDAMPAVKKASALAGASQVWRFVNEIRDDDLVVTYSPANRTYLVGQFAGPSTYHPEWVDDNMTLARSASWLSKEVDRDDLRTSTRNSPGSVLTVFRLPEIAQGELMSIAQGGTKPPPEIDIEEKIDDPLKDLESIAFERIKDQVNSLDWSDMQELVAGVLRSMGYKTQVAAVGSDRGRDILASPDGFGFQQPRIAVEVKHRSGKISSDQLRSFVGGRHPDDRGLYVSTGGFTKDAYYEADRANVPLTLWTLDELTRTLLENYSRADPETKQLIALKSLYVPS